jgi:hypothetical protein
MYVISTHTYSLYIELAISELEQIGIARKKILALPLDKRTEKRKLFDTISQSDGISLFDLAAVLGTAFMVLGTIYGYVLKWGPILGALLGLFIGAVLGLILDSFPRKKHDNKNKVKDSTSEVVMIVNCGIEQADTVERILFNNLAIGVSRFDKKENEVSHKLEN